LAGAPCGNRTYNWRNFHNVQFLEPKQATSAAAIIPIES
jgi:hypothetical protein